MADDGPDPVGDPAAAKQPPSPSLARRLGRMLLGVAGRRESATLLIVLAVIVFFHLKTMRPDAQAIWDSVFLSSNNIKAMLMGMSSEAILVVGMTVVIVGGGFDISVGSVLALSGLVAVHALKAGWPLSLGMAAGIACGAGCGLMNGVIVARLKVSPLIATLGMMMAARGLMTVHIGKYGAVSSSDLPESFLAIGQSRVFGIYGFWIVVIMLAAVTVGDVLLRNLRWLRQVYYMGGNERAAALSGINVVRVRTVTFVICGLTAGLAGVLNSARFGTATYEAGQGLELQVIAECVIGGAILVGGQGTVFGSFLGVVLIGCIKTGLTQIFVPPDWQYVIVGVALIFFVIVDIMLAKRRGV